MGKSRSRKNKKQFSSSTKNVDKTSENESATVSSESVDKREDSDNGLSSEDNTTPLSINDVVDTSPVGELDKSKEEQQDNSDNHSDADDASLVEARMIHTAIIEKDNPFIEEQVKDKNENEHMEVIATQRSQKLQNPNKIYENKNEDLLPLGQSNSLSPKQTELTSSSFNSSNESSKDTEILYQQTTEVNSMNRKNKVQILEANKISEGQGRTYIAYMVKYENSTVSRRYSDFESLRNILVRLFPIVLVPPIPKKQSIKNYSKSITGSNSKYLLPSDDVGSVDLSLSVINGSVTNSDEKLIRHRIRMLTRFLNRVLENPEISKTSIITDFLEPNNTNWNDFVASSAAFSSLPKNLLNSNPLDPTNTTRIYVCLPVPSSTQLMIPKDVSPGTKNTTQSKDSFQVIEQEYKRYEHLLEEGVYKYNKRVTKNLHDLRFDYKEIGEVAANFSAATDQDSYIQEQLSYVSDVYTESAILLEKLVSRLYYNVNEPLNEFVGMAGSAKDLIKFRKLKFIQNEMIKKSLNSRRNQLDKLQAQNSNFEEIDSVINEEIAKSQQISFERPKTESKGYGGKLFNKFNKLASLVKESVNYQEVDPRVTVTNLKREIQELEESLRVTEPDLNVISDIIKHEELAKFEKEREAEFSGILRRHANYMRSFAEKNLELWKNLKKQQTE